MERHLWLPVDDLEFRAAEEGSDSLGTLSGTAVSYDDTADIFGFKESFAPGAFGNVSGVDAIANFQHMRTSPLARTKGGGLTFTDSPEALRAEIEVPDTQVGRDTVELVKKKVLRGLSIEFVPDKYELNEEKATLRHTRSKLRGVGVVDTPAFKKSRVNLRMEEVYPDLAGEPAPEPLDTASDAGVQCEEPPEERAEPEPTRTFLWL